MNFFIAIIMFCCAHYCADKIDVNNIDFRRFVKPTTEAIEMFKKNLDLLICDYWGEPDFEVDYENGKHKLWRMVDNDFIYISKNSCFLLDCSDNQDPRLNATLYNKILQKRNQLSTITNRPYKKYDDFLNLVVAEAKKSFGSPIIGGFGFAFYLWELDSDVSFKVTLKLGYHWRSN